MDDNVLACPSGTAFFYPGGDANRSEPMRTGANQIALRKYGRDQQAIALLCGWKSDSCLCEIASETNNRRMPRTRLGRFALATGCNLVGQYRERIEAERRAKGAFVHRDEADRAADACLTSWSKAA